MKFLANENFPLPSIKRLRQAGHSVESIAETLSGIPDRQVIEIAIQKALVILTFDSDYGELIFRHTILTPPSVVYFRFKGQSPEAAGHLLLAVLAAGQIQLENNFTVIEENNIRQRRYI
jgi:predicted nuclease of predicted toxin-antitoxin system